VNSQEPVSSPDIASLIGILFFYHSLTRDEKLRYPAPRLRYPHLKKWHDFLLSNSINKQLNRTIMLQRKTGGLILAGLAAYAYYKYNKMSPQEKEDLVGNLKEKGRKLVDQYLPENVKNMFSKGNNNTAYAENNAF
jgi:hypothetical protein